MQESGKRKATSKLQRKLAQGYSGAQKGYRYCRIATETLSSKLAASGPCNCWIEGKGGKSSWPLDMTVTGRQVPLHTLTPKLAGLFPTDRGMKTTELCPLCEWLQQAAFPCCASVPPAVKGPEMIRGVFQKTESERKVGRSVSPYSLGRASSTRLRFAHEVMAAADVLEQPGPWVQALPLPLRKSLF